MAYATKDRLGVTRSAASPWGNGERSKQHTSMAKTRSFSGIPDAGAGGCELLVVAVPPLEPDLELFEHVASTIAMTVTSLIIQRLARDACARACCICSFRGWSTAVGLRSAPVAASSFSRVANGSSSSAAKRPLTPGEYRNTGAEWCLPARWAAVVISRRDWTRARGGVVQVRASVRGRDDSSRPPVVTSRRCAVPTAQQIELGRLTAASAAAAALATATLCLSVSVM